MTNYFDDLIRAALLLEGVREVFEERAAIREHDGQQPGPDAEFAAWAEALGAACREREQAEARALLAAQHAGEEYCDQIGVYDFREMTEGQAAEFMRWMIDAHRVMLQCSLRGEAPF